MFTFKVGRLSAIRLLSYSVVQIVGAFFGAMLIYFIHYDAINDYNGGVRHVSLPMATADIFATYPKPYPLYLSDW
ncbi:unnamed protein product [Toxocara canis]|uniref:MFS transporter n=1 Tax=Toxocara canis TaxID=6265 RepID=A0A183UWA6_TOXCA|nr:unnamed protein product [Toxocara canis]